MSAVDDILANLPIDQLASQLGESPDDVRAAAQSALPALLGGLHANAQDPAGEASLADLLLLLEVREELKRRKRLGQEAPGFVEHARVGGADARAVLELLEATEVSG